MCNLVLLSKSLFFQVKTTIATFELRSETMLGIEHILNDLDVNVGLDNTGFTLHKVLSKLVVKNLFAEVKLTDIPAWNPFSSPFSLGLSALQIIVEDAYSSDNRKVWFFPSLVNHYLRLV
jgi:hypothetical protein